MNRLSHKELSCSLIVIGLTAYILFLLAVIVMWSLR